MPWSPDEEKRVRRLEEQAASNTRRITDLESTGDRRRDQERHEFKTMLDAGVSLLTKSVQGIADQGQQTLAINRAQNATLEDARSDLKEVRSEIILAKEERLARKAREEVAAQHAVEAELQKVAAQAAREHRLKVWAIVVPIIVAVLGLLGAAWASHYR